MTTIKTSYAVIGDITRDRATVLSVHPSIEAALADEEIVESKTPTRVVGVERDTVLEGERIWLADVDDSVVRRGS